MKPSRRTYTILAVIALLALQTLPIASAQLSGNALYVYDHDPNSSNYYAYISLGAASIGAGQSGWINVSADVWLQSYSGSGSVSMLRISIGSTATNNQFAEFACVNGVVYARIVVGSNVYQSPNPVGSLDTSRYYPLKIEMHISSGTIDKVNFYVYDGAGSTVYSWPWSGSLSISTGKAYVVFGSPSESNGGLQYDLYVDNIHVASDISGISQDINYDFYTKTPSLSGQGYTTATVTTVSGYPPQPIPEPWIAGVVVLAVASTYMLVKSRRR